MKNTQRNMGDETKGYQKDQELKERLGNAKNDSEWMNAMEEFENNRIIEKIESEFLLATK